MTDRPARNPYLGPGQVVPPLTPRQEELRRVGEALRGLIAGFVATEAPRDDLAALADDLEEVAAGWAHHPRRTSYAAAAEAGPGGDVHAFLDDSPMIGRANPLAPPLRLDIEPGTDEPPAPRGRSGPEPPAPRGRSGPEPPAPRGRSGPEIVGTACFGPQYEGPPGHVHGGYLAAAFDEVLGFAQSLGGKPGMTGTLTVRYRSPTPLRVELALRGWVERVEGRKIFTRGTIHAGERLCAEAEAVFISIDFKKMAILAQQRQHDAP